jgi:hypothetical protein
MPIMLGKDLGQARQQTQHKWALGQGHYVKVWGSDFIFILFFILFFSIS